MLSLEMPKAQLHDRNVAVLGGIELGKVIDPRRLEDDDWAQVTAAIGRMERLALYLDDQGGLRLMDVRMKARAVKRRHGLDLLVIDYLQLMDGTGDNRNAQIEGITRGLKALAKEMQIGIILLSQLNRALESRPNKRPMPSDLRDSGAIEQDCDAALFLYRDEIYNEHSVDRGICEVNVGLIRQGEPGTVGLTYIANQTRFKNLEQGRVFGQQASRPLKSKYSGLKD
jgi:replicative DNA helicase